MLTRDKLTLTVVIISKNCLGAKIFKSISPNSKRLSYNSNGNFTNLYILTGEINILNLDFSFKNMIYLSIPSVTMHVNTIFHIGPVSSLLIPEHVNFACYFNIFHYHYQYFLLNSKEQKNFNTYLGSRYFIKFSY